MNSPHGLGHKATFDFVSYNEFEFYWYTSCSKSGKQLTIEEKRWQHHKKQLAQLDQLKCL